MLIDLGTSDVWTGVNAYARFLLEDDIVLRKIIALIFTRGHWSDSGYKTTYSYVIGLKNIERYLVCLSQNDFY